jgi:predicted  nucleic acid-binding Zn-ribbon protein
MSTDKISKIFEILYNLIEINKMIFENQSKRSKLLEKVDAYQQEIDLITIEFNDKKEKKIAKGKKVNELENKIGNIDEEIKNLEGDIPLIKTNEKYFELQDRINRLKEVKNNTEDKVLLLMEENEEYVRTFKELEKRKDENLAKINAEMTKNKAEIDQLESEISKKKKEKEDNFVLLPEIIKKRYLTLENKFPQSPIAYLNGDICTGCNMGVPPQVRENIKGKEKIEYCQNCGRVLLVNL